MCTCSHTEGECIAQRSRQGNAGTGLGSSFGAAATAVLLHLRYAVAQPGHAYLVHVMSIGVPHMGFKLHLQALLSVVMHKGQ